MRKADTALPPEALKRYRATLRRRTEEKRRLQEERGTRARRVAHQAARMLKKDFGASRVILFGSVANGRPLGERSDVDLAVWGLSPEEHLEAIAQVQSCSAGFSIDLIRMERCDPALREAILSEGVTP